MEKQTSHADLRAAAGRAAEFLRLLANENRLALLCALEGGEMSVGDLAAELDAIKADVARAKAIEDAAVKKGVLTRAEVDAEVKPVSAEVVRG